MSKLILKIPGETNYLAKIRQFVIAYAESIGFQGKIIGEIQFAVDEAATNIIKHAYDEDPDLPEDKRVIEVEVNEFERGLEITLKDRAKPFNPKNYPLPDLDKHVATRKTHGLGVFAMKKFMDEIDHYYEQGVGNVVTMRKYRRPE